MRKNAGLLTAVAVFLAFFGMSSLPKNSPGGTAPTAVETSKGTKAPTSTRKVGVRLPVLSGCKEIQNRLHTLFTPNRLPGTTNPKLEWTLPTSCYLGHPPSSQIQRENHGDVAFLIATAPNPISTHLPLSFDRILEIIQQAAQDNHYFYESSWLPWNEPKEFSHLSDELAAEDAEDSQEKHPGVLVFRNPSSQMLPGRGEGGLAVFVVSELPTGGINEDEFDNAVAWIRQLGGFAHTREVKILGPNFSGSLASLYRSLHFDPPDPSVPNLTFTVFSGSVSSDANYSWFSKIMADESLGTFRTAMEGDSIQIERFCKYIDSQGYPLDRVAFLSEDETAFGGTSPEKEDRICGGKSTYLYYPRDIATLRSAYEEQSIFSAAKQAPNSTAAATTLRGDLREPANSKHDTVRSYGGQLTPLAQESVLLNISDTLAMRKIQFVVLRSTNSLDQIFLGRFLRRTVPEIRVVMDGADLLFRRGDEGASLRGVMVLSTYPLLTSQQDWTSTRYGPLSWWQLLVPPPPSGEGGSYRIFGEDNAQGIYVAARELIPDRGSALESLLVADYAPPEWARSRCNEDSDLRPASWLTVIGHRQFWPVAVLNSYTLSGCRTACSAPNDRIGQSLLSSVADLKHVRFAISGDPRPVGHLPIEFGALMFVCLGWSVLHLLWCKNGSISPVPCVFRLTYFAPIPQPQHAVLIGFGSTVLASAAVIVATCSGLLRWTLGNWNGALSVVLLLAFAIPLFACWKNYKLPVLLNPKFSTAAAARSRQLAAMLSLSPLGVLIAVQMLLLHRLNDANLVFTFWRSVHLLSGVSPLLPQLFLLSGMYCWFWFSLRGLSLFGDDRPVLPGEKDLKSLDGKQIMPIFSREQAGTPIEELAMPLGKSYLRAFLLILPIAFVASTILLNERPWLRTLGERAFGIFVFLWVILCVSLILSDAAQCWATWRRLRVLLNHLDLLALRRTFNALQGMTWTSVWAMSGDVLAERYCLISRQIEAMRHLRNQLGAWTPTDPSEGNVKLALEQKIDAFFANNNQTQTTTKPKLIAFAEWYEECLADKPIDTLEPLREVQEEFASIAGQLAGTLLLPAWRSETESLIIDRAPKPKKEDEGYRSPVIYKTMPEHVLAAEEFFVLPYLGFIRNILGRIRTIVLGSLGLFVTTTFAISSYPFDPLPILGGIFLAVFIITGTTIVVIYAGMHRDATLSYVTDTSPGELGGEFWRQVFTFGVGPLIGLLTTLFPSITDFVVSWLQPGAQAIK